MFSREEVKAMELAAARAWPASQIFDLDGWKVRVSGGGARRANSVLPLELSSHRDVDAAISEVELIYRASKLRAYFQVSSISEPPYLDRLLAARGYALEDSCLLMAKRLAPSAMPDGIEVTDSPTVDWLSVYTEPLDATRKAAAPTVLANVPTKRAFLLVRDATGAPLSSALSVVSPDGIALVECVATRSAARRSGGGRRVMDAHESWSAANGAQTIALQVVAANTLARTLYERRGFAEVGRYHYRYRDV